MRFIKILWIAALLAMVAQAAPTKPPLYLTIVVHNEEPLPGYLDKPLYLRNREMVRKLAVLVKSKSAMMDFQSDWVFLTAVAKYDDEALKAATGGKNIVRWMVEDLGFDADPHGHETKYNYADIAYLHEQLGVRPTKVAGGFLFDPPDPPRNPQGWEQHEKGINGRVHPDYFWRADLLWGAGTRNHQGNDELRHGMWKPKDRSNFFEHDASRRLAYIGGNCYTWTNDRQTQAAAVHKVVAAIEKGEAPADGFYTANIFIAQGRLNDALLENIGRDLESFRPLAAQGKIVWSPLSRTAEIWRRDYKEKPFQYPCIGMEKAAAQPAALEQRRMDGRANVYVNFAINCHDWLDPDMSSQAVLRAARLFAKHKIRADFYLTEPLAYAYAEKVSGTIEELKKLGMAFGYHHRPPHPVWFDADSRRRILAAPPQEAYRELERYETLRLNLETGGLIDSAKGGYAGTAQLVGAAPLALGAGAAAPQLVAWDREVLRKLGARMLVAHHSGGDAQYPLLWWQGMLARPSDFSVVRVPPNSRQRAANIQVLPRGVATGEESGNFWWNVTDDPEAQEHAPAKYLARKLAQLPKDRLTFVTCLIHEDNWYKQGTSWDGTYFEDRGRKQPRTPPYKAEPRRMVRLRAAEEQARIWAWWEELVAAAAGDPRIRVATASDILTLVRTDDLERAYDRKAVVDAARKIAEPGERLPDHVALENDAFSLGDCVQAFTRALAGERELLVRTMVGPARRPGETPAALKVTAPSVVAAAKQLAPMLNERHAPDALPATVTIGGQDAALEAYLVAAARVLAGQQGEFEIPARRGPGPDPALWAVKPARRR